MDATAIKLVALEGLNRSGKGTQCALLKKTIYELGIPVVVLRGDGSRPGKGQEEGDPYDEWWLNFHAKLVQMDPSKRYEQWVEGANKLVDELLNWRCNLLPELMAKKGLNRGLIILDRSLISRLSLAKEFVPNCRLSQLYSTTGREETDKWREACPDLIFHLRVSQGVLLSRLDPNDPKHDFRHNLIRGRYEWQQKISARLPAFLRMRTIHLDGELSPEEIHGDIAKEVVPLLQVG